MENAYENLGDYAKIKCVLTPQQESRLQARLDDIEKCDPMSYRRDALLKHSELSGPLVTKEDLHSIAQLQNIFYDPVFTSHRKIVGPVIVLGKSLLHRFLRKWLGITLARQCELNQRIFNLAMTVHVLENRIRALEGQKDPQ